MLFWDGDGGCLGGLMIPYSDRKYVNGWGDRSGVVCLPRIEIRQQEEMVGWVQ